MKNFRFFLQKNLNKAHEQSTFIANIMNEAGVSGKKKLQVIKNIYGAMGIDLFEQINEQKSKVDIELDELLKQLASELTEKIWFYDVYVQALNLIQKEYVNKFLLD